MVLQGFTNVLLMWCYGVTKVLKSVAMVLKGVINVLLMC